MHRKNICERLINAETIVQDFINESITLFINDKTTPFHYKNTSHLFNPVSDRAICCHEANVRRMVDEYPELPAFKKGGKLMLLSGQSDYLVLRFGDDFYYRWVRDAELKPLLFRFCASMNLVCTHYKGINHNVSPLQRAS